MKKPKVYATAFRDRKGWSAISFVWMTTLERRRLDSHYTHTKGVREFFIKEYDVEKSMEFSEYLVMLAIDGLIQEA